MNLRTIKKDIEYLVGNVIDDCNLYMSLFPNKESQENNPDKSDPKKIKEHYRNIRKELFEGVDALCEKLSNVAGKNEEK